MFVFVFLPGTSVFCGELFGAFGVSPFLLTGVVCGCASWTSIGLVCSLTFVEFVFLQGTCSVVVRWLAPLWHFFGSFLVTCCSNLLYLSSSRAYLQSRLSHSFRIRSCNCSKFAVPSPSSSIAVYSVDLPIMISLESFFTLSRRLFSSTCLSYEAVGVTRILSKHFV